MEALQVRVVRSSDRTGWKTLFEGYRDFYGFEPSSDVVDRVWNWLIEPGHESCGIVAEIDGRVVGLANYRKFPRPSTGTVGVWLDDLFTEPTFRGRGIARALIAELDIVAAAEGCSVVRWITKDDNHRAQHLYDAIAQRTNWVVYDQVPGDDR
ncbi:GNAT family N-acetyltransferase [Yaniella halotolerans]|uniref:GNAT family N-acetyltransferase n=1 Tax=Yaniella halotolerans TaxID=225453 RepID=UPI0003B7524E|nr:GNAT family N-acetyltransferase [Yaniella halotolerans]